MTEHTLRQVEVMPARTMRGAAHCLLLDRGEFVRLSLPMDNPATDSAPLAEGRLGAVVPEGHPLAAKAERSARPPAREDFAALHDARVVRRKERALSSFADHASGAN